MAVLALRRVEALQFKFVWAEGGVGWKYYRVDLIILSASPHNILDEQRLTATQLQLSSNQRKT